MNVEDIIKLIYADKQLKALKKRIEEGFGTFVDTAAYCNRSAELLGRYFSESVLAMSDIERIAANDALLRDRYKDINELLDKVQRTVDKAQGLNIRPQHAPYNKERADQIGQALTDKTVPEETIRRRAKSAPANMTRSMQDNFIEENVEFRSKAGLKCYIVRISDGEPCEWCDKLAGRYEYGSEPEDVYCRHDNCGCTVTYENGRQRQNVWTKKIDSPDYDKEYLKERDKLKAGENKRLNRSQQRSLQEHMDIFSREQARKLDAEKAEKNTKSITAEERKELLSRNKADIAENAKANTTENENDTFSENSKIKSEEPITIVNKSDIDSPEYRKQFDNFDESPQVERTMYQESKNMLNHRTGTQFEDLSFIDSNTGKFITRTDYDKESKVEPTKRMYRMLRESEPYSIIAIHNHPKSAVPSIDDIGCAYDRRYKYGVIACHNGSLYRYSFLGEFDTSEANLSYVDMLLDNVNRIVYNKEKLADSFESKLADALNQLKGKNLNLEVFLWN